VNSIAPILAMLSANIRRLSERLGQRVDPEGLEVTDRTGHLPLSSPGRTSPNGTCRLVRAADGWIAINLARKEDLELVAAWLGAIDGSDWPLIEARVRDLGATMLIEDGVRLGLPVARVGEMAARRGWPGLTPLGETRSAAIAVRKVIDLSALWAGPLCGAVLAAMGAEVVKIESHTRPDPTRFTNPIFDGRLNGRKSLMRLNFADPDDRARLWREVIEADLMITSARPRAFAGLGLEPGAVFAARPDLVWVSVTGYGWADPPPGRVAFGDDAAAAGGLLDWSSGGEPRFLGDALADPITGLASASAALTALAAGGGVLVDAAMAMCAAKAASLQPMKGAP
jgi:hypothetical protein